MGFKYDDKSIMCPYFKRMVRTTDNQIIGIQCVMESKNLGFDMDLVMTLPTENQFKEFVMEFCKSKYGKCPCYQAHIRDKSVS